MPVIPSTSTETALRRLLAERVAIIDGAMGTTIRSYHITEEQARGDRFKDAPKDLKNNGDIYSLTRPAEIGDIHRRFLEAGADIIETNTFSATSIGQSEFFIEDPREKGGRKDPAFYQSIIENKFLETLAWDINFQSARQCREWADRIANNTGRRRYVAGAVGPLTVSLSNSPDHNDAGFRVVTFDQVKADYRRQMRALIAGGVDLLLVETIFDSLNAKAALVAIEEIFAEDKIKLPLMISAAVGRGGETMISAQTVGAFWNAVRTHKPLVVGLNCSIGPDLMRPFLEELGQKSDALFLLLTGRARVSASDTRGREVILATLSPGDYLGEMSLVDNEPHSASVHALVQTDVLELGRAEFVRCLSENASMALVLMRGLVRRLRQADRKIESLALLDVYGRVAHALLDLAETDAQGQQLIREKVSRQDMAKTIGASREMVSRVMKDLEARGFIETLPSGATLLRSRLQSLG